MTNELDFSTHLKEYIFGGGIDPECLRRARADAPNYNHRLILELAINSLDEGTRKTTHGSDETSIQALTDKDTDWRSALLDGEG